MPARKDESERRAKKVLTAWTDAEHHLAVLISERLGYPRGGRTNLATALREEFLKAATDEEVEQTVDWAIAQEGKDDGDV